MAVKSPRRFTIRLTLPMMRRKNWGVINVSSIYGLRGIANRIGVTTKTALVGLTRAVALERWGRTSRATPSAGDADAGA
jgi:NAD(P)-dependent dehydrogenase (short-subunit alcohol dehydrogenase family)